MYVLDFFGLLIVIEFFCLFLVIWEFKFLFEILVFFWILCEFDKECLKIIIFFGLFCVVILCGWKVVFCWVLFCFFWVLFCFFWVKIGEGRGEFFKEFCWLFIFLVGKVLFDLLLLEVKISGFNLDRFLFEFVFCWISFLLLFCFGYVDWLFEDFIWVWICLVFVLIIGMLVVWVDFIDIWFIV